jgi:hypothetical protein
MFKKITLLFILFICILNYYKPYAQTRSLDYTVELNSAISSNDALPFWMTANKFGSVTNKNYSTVYTSIFSDFNPSKSDFSFSYKASFTGLKEAKNNILVNELYTSARYKNIQLDLGVKHNNIIWEGLSSSNGNIVKSTNSRSLPGYNISLLNYSQLPFAKKWLSLKGNYSDYVFNDKRMTSNARLHAKSLFFKSTLNSKLELITGINHYVQWGGNSAIFGKQPSSFKDYLRIVSGKSGGSDATEGDQINALGNHLGSYLVQLNYVGEKLNWNFYYSHLFEDRSGREFQNWRDGLYGFFIDFKKPKALISYLLTEFTYTKHMSGASPPDQGYDEFGNSIPGRGLDNYFNNGIYGSGWTYFGNTIGSPYFTSNLTDEQGITQGVIVGDNRFVAFNLGLKGNLYNIPYKLIVSHTTYVGWFNAEYQPKPTQFSGYLEVIFPKINKFPLLITTGTAFDTGTYRPGNIGGFIKLTKKGIF